MRRTQLLCTIAAGLWSAAIAGSQAVPAAPSAQLRAHIQNERYDIVTSIRGLPLGIRDRLETMWGGALDIAEPGAQFQGARATGNSRLPTRRLVAAGCSSDFHCLVYYERGGTTPGWRAMLFHWTPDMTRLELGGTAPGGLARVEDVQRAVLSGGIKDPAGQW